MITRRAVLAGLASVAAVSRTPADAQTTVSCRIVGAAPTTRPDQGYIFLGSREGFFKSLGVSLDFSNVNGMELVTQLIASGQAQLSNNALPDFISLKQRQPSLPVRIIYRQKFKYAPYPVAVLSDSPVRSYADLKGHTIGLASLASGAVVECKALLRHAGIDPNDVTFVAIGGGAQALAALKTGRVDALCQYRGQLALMESLGTTFRFLPGSPLVDSIFVANNDAIATQRETLVRAMRCVILNEMFMGLNPEAAVHSFYALFGPPSGDPATALRSDVHLVTRTAQAFPPFAKDNGYTSAPDIQKTIDYLSRDGDMANTHIDIGSLYTNELVADINRVDPSLASHAAQALH